MNKDYQESEGLFSGKGFYIAMLLCVSIVAVSAWAIVRNKPEENADPVANVTDNMQNEADTQWEVWDEPTSEPETDIPDVSEVDNIQPEEPVKQVSGLAEPEPMPKPTAEPVVNLDEKTYIWPVVGEVSLPYSMDKLVYNVTMGDWRTHDGVDIEATNGQLVRAASAGTVEEVYKDELYGTTVVIDHGAGLVSYYANLQEVPTVKVGDKVETGDTIGAVGNTAICESAVTYHLHFAMSLNDESVDPNEYLPVM